MGICVNPSIIVSWNRQGRPEDELRSLYHLSRAESGTDQGQVKRLIRQVAETFQQQLIFGAPTDYDETGLRQLARQLRAGKLAVKIFLKHTLHAKPYLLYRENYHAPIVGFLGSSNLTILATIAARCSTRKACWST